MQDFVKQTNHSAVFRRAARRNPQIIAEIAHRHAARRHPAGCFPRIGQPEQDKIGLRIPNAQDIILGCGKRA